MHAQAQPPCATFRAILYCCVGYSSSECFGSPAFRFALESVLGFHVPIMSAMYAAFNGQGFTLMVSTSEVVKMSHPRSSAEHAYTRTDTGQDTGYDTGLLCLALARSLCRTLCVFCHCLCRDLCHPLCCPSLSLSLSLALFISHSLSCPLPYLLFLCSLLFPSALLSLSCPLSCSLCRLRC